MANMEVDVAEIVRQWTEEHQDVVVEWHQPSASPVVKYELLRDAVSLANKEFNIYTTTPTEYREGVITMLHQWDKLLAQREGN